ncbi:hypothetical protein NCLIV_061890 [Neospora caninum Liverpool]|uniref:Zinc finger protein ZFP1 n=1 Tax=Neospora caninum (strain Liverpool) TaxID=572307 RepID=F0VPW7_NEOCL|nr:hypothetical protein NCLIV_061890 [Neospora caninum Liverpool]CBZ55764.1 hypothetical protein NCLIV_061890 [Neospora caninum Liverpool]CEL70508.1 TPA: zinc finger protein ZFP1 [Neospora caninum Liverpool]|eukprot:XP_003885790.1 hypothetical protein NCLIV_061890 [Neospora caninum Liverpool]
MEHRIKRSNRPRSKTGTVCISAPSTRVTSSVQQANLAREIFWKTQLCPKLHSTGVCARKDHCSFAHSQEELRTPPDLRCTKWCRRVFRGQVCDDPGCPYAHSKEDLRCNGHQLLTFKTAMCKFHAKGVCLSGESCRFAHTAEELRGGADEASTHSEDRLQQDTSRGSISTSSETSGQDCGESAVAAHLVTSALRALESLNKARIKNTREKTPPWEEETGRSPVGLASGIDAEPEDALSSASLPHSLAKGKYQNGTHLMPGLRVGVHHAFVQRTGRGRADVVTERKKSTARAVEILEGGPCDAGALPATNNCLRKAPSKVESATQLKRRVSVSKDQTEKGRARKNGSLCSRQNDQPKTVPKTRLLSYKLTLLKRGKQDRPLFGMDAAPVRIAVGPREESAFVSVDSPRTGSHQPRTTGACPIYPYDASVPRPEARFARESASRSSSGDSRHSVNNSSLNPEAPPFIPALLLGSSTQHGVRLGASPSLPGLRNLATASFLSSDAMPIRARETFLVHGNASSPASLGGAGASDVARFLQETMTALSAASPEGPHRHDALLRDLSGEAAATGASCANVACSGSSLCGEVGAGMNSTLFPGLPTAVAADRGESQGAAALAALLAVSRLLSPTGNGAPPVNAPSNQRLPGAFASSAALGESADPSRRLTCTQEKNDSSTNAWSTLVAALVAMAPHLAKSGTSAAAHSSPAYQRATAQTAEHAGCYRYARWVGSGPPPAVSSAPPTRDLLDSCTGCVAPPVQRFPNVPSSLAETSRKLPSPLESYRPAALSSVETPSRPTTAVGPLASTCEASAALSAWLDPFSLASSPQPPSVQPFEQLNAFLGLSSSAPGGAGGDASPLCPHLSSFSDSLAFANRHGLQSRHPHALFPIASQGSYDGAGVGGRTEAGWRDSVESFSGALRTASLPRSTQARAEGPSSRPVREGETHAEQSAAERGKNGSLAVTAGALVDVFSSVAFIDDSQRAGDPRKGEAVQGRSALTTGEGTSKGDLDMPSPLLTVTTEPGPSLASRGSFAAGDDLLSGMNGVEAEADANKDVLFGDEREAETEIWATFEDPAGARLADASSKREDPSANRAAVWVPLSGLSCPLPGIPKEEPGAFPTVSSTSQD